MSILALDWGSRRVGVAISESEILAKRLITISYSDEIEVIKKIKKICQDYQIQKIIIGLPKTLTGQEGSQAHRIKKSIQKLKKALGLPIYFYDETLTTVEAEKNLLEAKLNKSQIKKIIDSEAARIILQDYLNQRGK